MLKDFTEGADRCPLFKRSQQNAMNAAHVGYPVGNGQALTLRLATFAQRAKRWLARLGTLVSGAAVCYTAILGLLIYNVASYTPDLPEAPKPTLAVLE